MSRRQSRAAYYGLKPKPLAAKIKRKLAKLRVDIGEMGLAFEDIDQSLVGAGEQLVEAFDEFEKEVDEGLEYWLENHEPEL